VLVYEMIEGNGDGMWQGLNVSDCGRWSCCCWTEEDDWMGIFCMEVYEAVWVVTCLVMLC